jgi:flagellar protein FliO/FliZ
MKLASVLAAVLTGYASSVNAAAQPATSAVGDLFQVLLGLAVVLGLMMAAAWALKRFGVKRMAGGAAIRVIGGVSLGGRERILLVEAADLWIVVGVAPGRVNTLATMPRQETPPDQTSPVTTNFSDWLKQTIEKRNAN